jgi:hypothetical protein
MGSSKNALGSVRVVIHSTASETDIHEHYYTQAHLLEYGDLNPRNAVFEEMVLQGA